MIDKVELENFKSFYGNKVMGPLHKNFTAVVGPNGSGKSNCIEALLFVFGKRAKQLRLNKLSELVHRSKEHKHDGDSHLVGQTFQSILDDEDHPDNYEIIPGSIFTVARKVTRSSASTYYLNGSELPFREVCELLKSKGIHLDHNRFLILQGEVEQIALMAPKGKKEDDVGLLEYLEDIIGSNGHVARINELERAVELRDEARIE